MDERTPVEDLSLLFDDLLLFVLDSRNDDDDNDDVPAHFSPIPFTLL